MILTEINKVDFQKDCQPIFIKKSEIVSQKSQKKPDRRFMTLAHKMRITKQKTDVKTR